LTALQVVGLGMATLDVLVRLREMPTWEQGTRLSAFGFDGGGPVGTAIVAAARLGARVGFVGTAGNDEAAELKLRSLVKEGVDLSHLVRRPRPEREVIVVFVDAETGERVFAGLQGIDEDPLTPEELDRAYITSAEYLHLEGFHYRAALQAACWMHEAGKKVVYDGSKVTRGNRLQLAEIMAQVDVLIGGSGFVPALTGEANLWAAGRAALKLGPSIVVQTEGAEGSYTVTPVEEFHTPAFAVPVVDTTGAGDVFHGAYIVGLLRRWGLPQTATFASAVSALKCMHLGGRAGIPRYGQVMDFLREQGVSLPASGPMDGAPGLERGH
jgi:sulfofructose kinase